MYVVFQLLKSSNTRKGLVILKNKILQTMQFLIYYVVYVNISCLAILLSMFPFYSFVLLFVYYNILLLRYVFPAFISQLLRQLSTMIVSYRNISDEGLDMV